MKKGKNKMLMYTKFWVLIIGLSIHKFVVLKSKR